MGWPVAYPQNSLRFCERFLHMMFSVPTEDYEGSEVAAKALDLLFILQRWPVSVIDLHWFIS